PAARRVARRQRRLLEQCAGSARHVRQSDSLDSPHPQTRMVSPSRSTAGSGTPSLGAWLPQPSLEFVSELLPDARPAPRFVGNLVDPTGRNGCQKLGPILWS